ncbi:MAG TPA: HDOD domain-containing protein [Gammaproteobacteria bacterium]|nr:HDOD domain-containing protein [Gammaproteobacteria bacterium]
MNNVAEQWNEQAFIEELLSDLESGRLVLPTLPDVALRVRDAVEDENASASNIAKAVSTDAALSARLLQVANSPLYRPRTPVDNLQTAIARLGQKQIQNLVISLVMQQMFQATDEVLEVRLRGLWEHNVEVAAICHVLASAIPVLQSDQALMAGLVHDIGILPILVRAEEVHELLDHPELLDSVTSKLHTQIGAHILKQWSFPETLVHVVQEHENMAYDHDGNADYTDLVIVANLKSHAGTDHALASVDWSGVSAFERLGLDTEMEVIIMDENLGQVEEIQEMLGG